MAAIAATDAYARGDLEAEAAYYRIHFRMTLRRPDRPRSARGATQCATSRRKASSSRGRSSIGCTRRHPSSADWDLFPALRAARRPDPGAARRARLRPRRAGRADRRGGSGSAPLGAARLRPLHLPRGAGGGLRGDLPLLRLAGRPARLELALLLRRLAEREAERRQLRPRDLAVELVREAGAARPRARRGRAGARRAPARRRRGP